LEILYVLEDRSQNQKKILFFTGLPPCPLKLSYSPRGDPRNLEKVQNYPQPVKRAILFRANPVILLLQVSSLILKNLHYILSDL
jgi:hypothetical protein